MSMSSFLFGINIIARRADERAAFGRIEFGNGPEERIEMDVRHARIEQAVEPLDEAEDFDLELVGARDRAMNRGVERGRVAAGGENADAFHKDLILTGQMRNFFTRGCVVANGHGRSSNNVLVVR